jgi:hypothetical protein
MEFVVQFLRMNSKQHQNGLNISFFKNTQWLCIIDLENLVLEISKS